jgi:tRNA A22 N-methylase
MKIKFCTFLIILIVITGTLSAQMNNRMGRMRAKVEQLEKLKLIEVLNLNEEKSIRFFSRRNKYKIFQKKLLAERDSLYKVLSGMLSSGKEMELVKIKNEIFNLDNKILVKRREFLSSLKDILTEKEIAKYILFEYNFKNEIRKQLMKQYKLNKRRM